MTDRKLDRQVALKLFRADAPHRIMPEYNLLHFSTDIACAWKVVERMKYGDRKAGFKLLAAPSSGFQATFYWNGPHESSWEKSASRAISLAALKAVESTG